MVHYGKSQSRMDEHWGVRTPPYVGKSTIFLGNILFSSYMQSSLGEGIGSSSFSYDVSPTNIHLGEVGCIPIFVDGGCSKILIICTREPFSQLTFLPRKNWESHQTDRTSHKTGEAVQQEIYEGHETLGDSGDLTTKLDLYNKYGGSLKKGYP